MQKIKILAIVGKAGSGKDTLMQQILTKFPDNFHEIVSYTTRPPREGEVDGQNYHFTSVEEFTRMLLSGDFLEATEFNDWHYGTAASSLSLDTMNIGVFNPDGIDALSQDPRVELTVLYITVSDKQRLLRQLTREEEPDVEEILRRYRTDRQDFEQFDTWSWQVFPKVFPNEDLEDMQGILDWVELHLVK